MNPEDHERLERFLEWRRVEGRGPRARWRWVPWVAATLALGMLLAFGALMLVAALTDPVAGLRESVAVQGSPAPAERSSEPVPPPEPARVDSAPAERAPALLPDRPVVDDATRVEIRPNAAPSFPAIATEHPSTTQPPIATERPRAAPPPPTLPPADRTDGERARPGARTPPELWGSTTADEVLTALKRPPGSARRRAMSEPPAERPLAERPSSEPSAAAAPEKSEPPVSGPAPVAPGETTAATAQRPPAPPIASPPVVAPSPAATPPPVTPPAATRAPSPPIASTSPTPNAPAPVRPPLPPPEVAKKSLPQPLEALKEPIERLKKWVDYVPEVRAGKAIYRWVRSQPPVESQPTPQPESRPPQSR